MPSLTHFDETGNAQMVDVGDKPITKRRAVAEGWIQLSQPSLQAVLNGESAKGNAGSITRAQLEEIAKTKLPDLNCTDIQSAMRVIEGTARNMGVAISD